MKATLGTAAGAAAGFLAAVVAIQAGMMPTAEAQAAAAGAGPDGATVLATGGGTNNQNDLCWVLTRVKPARGLERTVLALYRAERGGDHFTLRTVRFIDPDLRAVDLNSGNKPPSVRDVLNALPAEDKAQLTPPPPPPPPQNK